MIESTKLVITNDELKNIVMNYLQEKAPEQHAKIDTGGSELRMSQTTLTLEITN